MINNKYAFSMIAAVLLVSLSVTSATAETAMSKRAITEARVRADVTKDSTSSAATPIDLLHNRTCIDGRSVADVPSTHVIEYWVNLECAYCNVKDAVQAQRELPDMCILVRHIPTKTYSESLKKSLSYEGLKKFSPNAANGFWESIVPKTGLTIPVPYEAAFIAACEAAAISPSAVSEAIESEASSIVASDIEQAGGRISSTPTFIIEGIRFPSCDFKASQLKTVIGLVRKARAGDTQAFEKVVEIITNGLLGVDML